jgi:hypothetical protein
MIGRRRILLLRILGWLARQAAGQQMRIGVHSSSSSSSLDSQASTALCSSVQVQCQAGVCRAASLCPVFPIRLMRRRLLQAIAAMQQQVAQQVALMIGGRAVWMKGRLAEARATRLQVMEVGGAAEMEQQMAGAAGKGMLTAHRGGSSAAQTAAQERAGTPAQALLRLHWRSLLQRQSQQRLQQQQVARLVLRWWRSAK